MRQQLQAVRLGIFCPFSTPVTDHAIVRLTLSALRREISDGARPRSRGTGGFESRARLSAAVSKSLSMLLVPGFPRSELSSSPSLPSHLRVPWACRIPPRGVHVGQLIVLECSARTILSTLPIPKRL